MNSFGCQSVCSLSDHIQNDFLINSFFNGTSVSKNEASLFPPLTLDATAPSYTWEQQKHQQQNQEFFSSLFPYEMACSTQNSPEEALNMLLFEYQQTYPTPTPSAQPIPGIHFYSPDNSSSMMNKFDSTSFGYTPLSPASMYSDSIECAVSNVSNSVQSTPFPQQLGYPDDQMPQTSHETEIYTSVMGNSNQTCLSKQLYYQPDYCYSISEDQSFKPIIRQTQRRTRRRTIHPSQLQCTICSKTFSRPYNLKSHQRTHTNERPYRCTHPDCGWTFARPHDLKRHELLHSGVKPHTCSCGKKFSRRDAFKRHQTVDTGCARKKKARQQQ